MNFKLACKKIRYSGQNNYNMTYSCPVSYAIINKIHSRASKRSFGKRKRGIGDSDRNKSNERDQYNQML